MLLLVLANNLILGRCHCVPGIIRVLEPPLRISQRITLDHSAVFLLGGFNEPPAMLSKGKVAGTEMGIMGIVCIVGMMGMMGMRALLVG